MQIYYKYIYLIVKVHGVLPSTANMFASARTIQFHEFHTWDSIAVVTPFMHDTNYVSRDFAHVSFYFNTCLSKKVYYFD